MKITNFITCKPFIRKDFTSKNGTQAIYLRITIPKDYLIFTTGIRIMPENWAKKFIALKEPYSREKNIRLKKLIAKAQKIIDYYFFEGKTLTRQIFISEFFTPTNIHFFD